MKRHLSLLSMLLLVWNFLPAQEVAPEVMQNVYEEVKTPYKYGLVVVPAHDRNKIDCPTVFRENGKWYMVYIIYDGQAVADGRGYETWLAESDNLLDWKNLGKILSYGTDEWDASQRAGYLALQEYKWGGGYAPERFDGKCWLSYIGGDAHGYEAGELSIGIASTEGDPTKVHEWDRMQEPALRPNVAQPGSWDGYTLYKSSVMWDKKKHLGAPFVMYYNAKGSLEGRETIGIALSDDMKTWRRYGDKPVLDHPQGGITGDAQIQRMGDLYVMFYFGAGWKGKSAAAFNRFACSYDLAHWTDWTGEDLVAPSEPYDNVYAHKSFVLKYKGVVYHFYCAVNDKDQRGIAVAMSKDLGKSGLSFK